MGLLGIGLPDIPLFTAMILKVFMKSPGYGLFSRTQEERRFLLQPDRTALSHGEALGCRTGAGPLHRFGPLGRRHHTAPPDRCDGRSLSGELLYMKFLQGIPLAGAVGGAYDVIYLHRIQTYARIKYHKRFLLSRKNELAFTAEPLTKNNAGEKPFPLPPAFLYAAAPYACAADPPFRWR